MTSQVEVFVRLVRKRSIEHRHAMNLLATAGLAGQMMAVLRQELDSMVRVIYLLAQNPERRALLIRLSVEGKKWPRITDRKMVELAQTLKDWTQSVYKFGCAFIHLSGLHDYSDRDPLTLLPEAERLEIFHHCRVYHGGPNGDHMAFDDLVPYFPRVLDKIADNLLYYLAALERGFTVEHLDYDNLPNADDQ